MDSIHEFTRVIAWAAFKIFRTYFEIIERVIRTIDPSYKLPPFLKGFGSQNLDSRIAKIDSARENLQDAIHAIDELRQQAQGNKAELDDALQQLALMEGQKSAASAELEALRQLAGADTEAFRRVVGIPTKSDIWRERVVGFGSGVLASVLASLVYALIQSAF